jgi:hypothetical protein
MLFSADRSNIGTRMKQFSLPNVSVGRSGGEHFQVHVSDKQDAVTLTTIRIS